MTVGKGGSRLLALMIFATALLPVSPGRAQRPAMVTGFVTDSVGNPVFGAAVSIVGTSLSAMTDQRGQFRITGVPTGVVEIRARRLGFVPTVREAQVTPQATAHRVDLRMSALPTTLRPVVVQADRVEYRGRLAGYYERLQRRSTGQFISREEIDRKEHRSLSRLLAQVAGINAFQLRRGGGVVRMRGQNCRPLVWLDGVPLPAGEVDLDAFPASTIHGIELYLGSTTAPLDYTAHRGQSSCGTILLWSRGPDTDPTRQPERRRVDLDGLVSSLSIYTPDQVDNPARLDNGQLLEVTYPPSLSAAGTSGSVVAEFVVDRQGKIEPGTLEIVSSSHALFSAAVTNALEFATYIPATKDGKAVRQVVHQPVHFALAHRRAQSR